MSVAHRPGQRRVKDVVKRRWLHLVIMLTKLWRSAETIGATYQVSSDLVCNHHPQIRANRRTVDSTWSTPDSPHFPLCLQLERHLLEALVSSLTTDELFIRFQFRRIAHQLSGFYDRITILTFGKRFQHSHDPVG